MNHLWFELGAVPRVAGGEIPGAVAPLLEVATRAALVKVSVEMATSAQAVRQFRGLVELRSKHPATLAVPPTCKLEVDSIPWCPFPAPSALQEPPKTALLDLLHLPGFAVLNRPPGSQACLAPYLEALASQPLACVPTEMLSCFLFLCGLTKPSAARLQPPSGFLNHVPSLHALCAAAIATSSVPSSKSLRKHIPIAWGLSRLKHPQSRSSSPSSSPSKPTLTFSIHGKPSAALRTLHKAQEEASDQAKRPPINTPNADHLTLSLQFSNGHLMGISVEVSADLLRKSCVDALGKGLGGCLSGPEEAPCWTFQSGRCGGTFHYSSAQSMRPVEGVSPERLLNSFADAVRFMLRDPAELLRGFEFSARISGEAMPAEALLALSSVIPNALKERDILDCNVAGINAPAAAGLDLLRRLSRCSVSFDLVLPLHASAEKMAKARRRLVRAREKLMASLDPKQHADVLQKLAMMPDRMLHQEDAAKKTKKSGLFGFFKSSISSKSKRVPSPSSSSSSTTPEDQSANDGLRESFAGQLMLRGTDTAFERLWGCLGCATLRYFRYGERFNTMHPLYEVCSLHRDAIFNSPTYPSLPYEGKIALLWPSRMPLGNLDCFSSPELPIPPHNLLVPRHTLRRLFSSDCHTFAPGGIYTWSEMDINHLCSWSGWRVPDSNWI